MKKDITKEWSKIDLADGVYIVCNSACNGTELYFSDVDYVPTQEDDGINFFSLEKVRLTKVSDCSWYIRNLYIKGDGYLTYFKIG